MADRSNIGWTDATWQLVAGCYNASPGCDHCYAGRMAATRLKHLPVYSKVTDGRSFNGHVQLLERNLDLPLRWRKPRRVFVCSMSDLWQPKVPADFIESAYRVMEQAGQHTFQVLTKRPMRMSAVLNGWQQSATPREPLGWAPPPNVWAGASIESNDFAWRADYVRATPAARRFLSCEPMLDDLTALDLTGIDWVIIGCESGPGARPFSYAGAEALVLRARAAGAAVFVKQVPGRRAGSTITAVERFPAALRFQEYP